MMFQKKRIFFDAVKIQDRDTILQLILYCERKSSSQCLLVQSHKVRNKKLICQTIAIVVCSSTGVGAAYRWNCSVRPVFSRSGMDLPKCAKVVSRVSGQDSGKKRGTSKKWRKVRPCNGNPLGKTRKPV